MNAVPRRVELTGDYPVRIEAALNAGEGRVLNLSDGGVYVATRMNLLPQAQVHLWIDLPDRRDPLQVEAVVVWENRGRRALRENIPPGYGLRFIKLTRETAGSIRDFLQTSVEVPSGVAAATPSPEVMTFTTAVDGTEVRVEEVDGPPYRLREPEIERLTAEDGPGIFVLSYDRTQDAFVGRADTSLRETLTGFVGEYAYFYFERVDRAEERFFRECELFHRLGGDHGQLDNAAHPASPPFRCPVCRPPVPPR